MGGLGRFGGFGFGGHGGPIGPVEHGGGWGFGGHGGPMGPVGHGGGFGGHGGPMGPVGHGGGFGGRGGPMGPVGHGGGFGGLGGFGGFGFGGGNSPVHGQKSEAILSLFFSVICRSRIRSIIVITLLFTSTISLRSGSGMLSTYCILSPSALIMLLRAASSIAIDSTIDKIACSKVRFSSFGNSGKDICMYSLACYVVGYSYNI
ncbi:MAG: hypothetical protein FWG10_12125 [Eubacteriaceae bacterium]|nr:hypothetical protein [Eubacteriaceae bacterium]